MIGATIGIDVTYNVANVFITTSLPQSQQGLAGALINSLVFSGDRLHTLVRRRYSNREQLI